MTPTEADNKNSPFKFHLKIHDELKIDFKKIRINDAPIEELDVQKKLDSLYEWISSTPRNTTYRVNLLKTTTEQVIEHLNNVIAQVNHNLL